jgi:hypothetical protein
VLAFIVLLLIDAPSLGTVIFLAVLTVVLLLLVEMFRTTAVRSRPTQ